jgi:hypothetical protein
MYIQTVYISVPHSATRLSLGAPTEEGAENFVSTNTFSTPPTRLSKDAYSAGKSSNGTRWVSTLQGKASITVRYLHRDKSSSLDIQGRIKLPLLYQRQQLVPVLVYGRLPVTDEANPLLHQGPDVEVVYPA